MSTPKREQEYRLRIIVTADGVDKPDYEPHMEAICKMVLNELKAICRSHDQGTGRLTVEAEQIK